MNTTALNNIIKSFDINDIERGLVCHCADTMKLDLSSSKFLSNYIDDFVPSKPLQNAVDSIGELSIESLSVAMELLIPSADKVVNGAFFTPSYIVDYIVDNVAPKIDDVVADISCGSGAFLLGVLRYFIKHYSCSVKEVVSKNLYGADILEYNIQRSKIILSLFALSKGETLEDSDFNLIHCDSLAYKWNIKFDCIVGNPPYVKFQDLEETTRNFLTQNYETTSFGTFNLYFAFFEAGYNLLNEDGRLGYITPNNYFTSLAGESLRTYFEKLKCVYKIVDFNSTKVFDVQTYTAISFLSKSHNEYIHYGRIKAGQSPSDFLNLIYFSSNFYSDLNKKKWRLLCGAEQFNIRQIETIGEPIGELFNICVGIATLKDDIYSFFPIKEDCRYFYFERDNILWQVEKSLARSTVKISDIKNQIELNNNNRYFLFPYKKINGKMVAIPEDEMASKYQGAYSYFIHFKEILDSRGKGKHKYTPFYSYGRTQGLNRTGVKLYTPTFSKHPRFLVDLNEDSLFTNGYGIFFREKSDTLFESNPISEIENLDVIQKILNSEIMDYYITATSVAIDGGYPCYQKNFIEKFTIPYLEQSQINELRELTSQEDINMYLENIYNINLREPNLCS